MVRLPCCLAVSRTPPCRLAHATVPPARQPPACHDLPPWPAPLTVCSTHEFKYSSFHDSKSAARSAAAKAAAAAEAKAREAKEAAEAAEAQDRAVAVAGEGGSGGPSVAQRLKQHVDRVAAAAEAEALGGAGKPGKSRRGRALARPAQRPAGVLYLDERAATLPPAGVLHIAEPVTAAEAAGAAPRPEEHGAPAAQLPHDLPVGAALDARLGNIVDGVGRSIKCVG